MTKCEEYSQQFAGTDNYNCQTCFHSKGHHCQDAQDNMCCAYWYDPNSEIVGIAYQQAEDEMSLFASINQEIRV